MSLGSTKSIFDNTHCFVCYQKLGKNYRTVPIDERFPDLQTRVHPPCEKILAKEIFLYDTLGVQWNSDFNEIRSAFLELAKRWHPDKNPNVAEATSKFASIKEAFDILSSPILRDIYNTHGLVAVKNHLGQTK